MRHREQQIRGRLVLLRRDVPIALQATVRAADQDRRRVVPIVLVAIAHPTAPVEQRVIQQRAVPILRGF